MPWKPFYFSVLQDSWREFANAFANERTLFSLHSAQQVRTSYALTSWTIFVTHFYFYSVTAFTGSNTCSFSFWHEKFRGIKSVSFLSLFLFYFLCFVCSVYAAVLPDFRGFVSLKVCSEPHE